MRNAQTREAWFAQKFCWLKRAALAFAICLTVSLPVIFAKYEPLAPVIAIILLFSGAWFIGVLTIIPILHWKDRYRGERSTLWAIFLVFETSGWSKIFYWFMHVLPDRRKSGRYAIDEVE